MKSRKSFIILIVIMLFSAGIFSYAEVAFAQESGIITCGRGQDMCTLCDLIKGMNTIIKYLMRLAIGVALLAMAIGGVMYVISAGDKGLADKAKGAITNAIVGFAIIFAGWLIINTTINYIGAKKDPVTGASTFGMNIKSWGEFECNRVEPILNK